MILSRVLNDNPPVTDVTEGQGTMERRPWGQLGWNWGPTCSVAADKLAGWAVWSNLKKLGIKMREKLIPSQPIGYLISCTFCDGVYTDKYFYIFSECFPLIKTQVHPKTHPQTDPFPCPCFPSSVSLLLFPLALIFQAALIISRCIERLTGQKLIFLSKPLNITLDLLLTGHFFRSCLSARMANVYFVSGLPFLFFLY